MVKENYLKFLRFVENYYWVCQELGNSALFRKDAISSFLDIPRRTLTDYFNNAIETDNLMRFIRRTRKNENGKIISKNALCEYDVFLKKTRDYINSNSTAIYNPTDEERIKSFSNFCQYSKELSHPEKAKERADLNAIYRKHNGYILDYLRTVNELRPPFFYSSYLEEGNNREYNALCSSKNPKNKDSKRYELINKYLGIKNIAEWDAKSSIYRISYALNRKQLLPHDVDIYCEVWNQCGFSKPLGEHRDSYKQIFMPIYMADGKNNMFWERVVSGKIRYPQGKINQDALEDLTGYLGISTKELMDRTYEQLILFLGCDTREGNQKCERGSIFIPESNVHILIQYYLWTAGFKAINVYDCCYFARNELDEKYIQDLHDKSLKIVIENYTPLLLVKNTRSGEGKTCHLNDHTLLLNNTNINQKHSISTFTFEKLRK